MVSSFFFELLKLRKRLSTWVLGFVLVLVVLFFDYYQFYSVIISLEEGGSDPTGQITNIREFKEYLLPASVTVNVAGLLATFGGSIALILGFSDQSKIMETITYVLLSRNGGELANSLGEAPQAFTSPDPTDSAQAALVLGCYVAGLLLLAAFLFRRRDVT